MTASAPAGALNCDASRPLRFLFIGSPASSEFAIQMRVRFSCRSACTQTHTTAHMHTHAHTRAHTRTQAHTYARKRTHVHTLAKNLTSFIEVRWMNDRELSQLIINCTPWSRLSVYWKDPESALCRWFLQTAKEDLGPNS
jgi:hypothetical protein